jgi:hypothetical protein
MHKVFAGIATSVFVADLAFSRTASGQTLWSTVRSPNLACADFNELTGVSAT